MRGFESRAPSLPLARGITRRLVATLASWSCTARALLACMPLACGRWFIVLSGDGAAFPRFAEFSLPFAETCGLGVNLISEPEKSLQLLPLLAVRNGRLALACPVTSHAYAELRIDVC